ncbi:MAG: hypothetical protein P4L81_03315 [Candidatus Pacebacteria bacterium]|nr:hypothetical protein [Candidatus Paceibacterota bacterium]
MKTPIPKSVPFKNLKQRVFFRMETPTPEFPWLLVSIFEGNLPQFMQSPNVDQYALFSVTAVTPGRVTIEEIDHTIPDEALVIPSKDLPVGAWILVEYRDEGLIQRTIGLVNENGEFELRKTSTRNKRRKARQKEEKEKKQQE